MPRKHKPKQLHAYTDESGNSGLKLFDLQQPYFWTCTVLTATDLDSIHPQVVQKTLDRANATELHGSALGLAGLEAVANRLRHLITKYQIQVVFTRIEKSYLAVTKFTDTVLDSGTNKAVMPFTYNVKLFRLYFANIFAGVMTEEDRRGFWAAYLQGNSANLVPVFASVKTRANDLLDDPRSKQILNDALTWAEKYPDALIVGRAAGNDSPNFIALCLIINALHSRYAKEAFPITTFIHDEQNQFGSAMKHGYELLSPIHMDDTAISFLPEVKDTNAFQCEFEVRQSSDCFGLQLADVILWMVRRVVDCGDKLDEQSAALFGAVYKQQTLVSDLTQANLVRWVGTEMQKLMMEVPLGPREIERGRKFVDQLEQQRLTRMKEPPE